MLQKKNMLLAMGVVGGLIAAPAFGEHDESKKKYKGADIKKVSDDECEKDHETTANRQHHDRRRSTLQMERRDMTFSDEFRPSLKRATELKGMPVTNFQGEDLGAINEILIDVDRSRAAYGILDRKASLGGERVAIPWNAIHGSRHADRLLVSADRRQLEMTGTFKDDEIGMKDRQWAENVHNRYGCTPYWSEERKERASGREVESRTLRPSTAGPGQLVSLSLLTGADVKGADGKSLGEIEDLMIDMDRGQVAYFVLEHGGVGRLGATYYPIPLQVCTVTTSRRECDVSCSETLAGLESKPGFDRDEWLAMSDDVEWNERVYRAYDSEPYWVVYGYTTYREPVEVESTTINLERRFRTEDVRPYAGKITRVTRVERVDGDRDWVVVHVRLDPDKQAHKPHVHPPKFRHPSTGNIDAGPANDVVTKVYVAPNSYLAREDITLREGDRILLNGCLTRAEGRNVIIPTQITRGTRTVLLRDMQGDPRWSEVEFEEREIRYEDEREFEYEREREFEYDDEEIEYEDGDLEIEMEDDEIEIERD